MMFADCVVLWAAAVNFGKFFDDAGAVVWAAAVGPASGCETQDTGVTSRPGCI